MCTKCWVIVAVLLVVSAGLVFKFVIQGDVRESPDGRAAIQLTSSERDLVLGEMRVFLESIQKISVGISEKDMQMVAEYARRSGSNAQRGVPGSLVGKLPLAFKKLGFDTHAKFDQLALDAEQLGDPEHALSQMSVLLGNCVACHAAYRFEADAGAPAQ